MFLDVTNKYNNEIAFVYKIKNAEYRVTYKQLFDDVLLLCKAFEKKGMSKGDKVMFVSDNRYEWIMTDFALLALGAIGVPRGTDTPTDELQYIMSLSECKYIIIENDETLNIHKEMLAELNLSSMFVLDDYANILENEKPISQDDIEKFMSYKTLHKMEDVFTIIFTSGTTGKPKGVLLNHTNMMYNVDTIPDAIKLQHSDEWLSILPSWHVFERAAEYVAISKGSKIIYSSIKTFAADLECYKPTMVATVPRLWESMYAKIINTLSKDPTKAAIFNTLIEISKLYKKNLRILRNQLPMFEVDSPLVAFRKKIIPFIKVVTLFPFYLIAKKKLSLVQKKFGGKLKLAISGGGALPDYVDEWIDAIGIRIVNAYGMTEASPLITGRGLNCDIFGTVGPAFEGTKLRVVDEFGYILDAGVAGEIEITGPQVMSGYYNNEEETKKTFTDDGYLKTGDLGKLTIGGELILTGRSKEIIVLSSGENVDPSRIESALSIFPYITDAMLVGQDKKGLGLLIVADFELLKEYISSKLNKAVESAELVMEDKKIISEIKRELNEILHKKNGFKPFEKIQNIHFLDKEFKVGEELTNTLKKKRHIIEKKYHELINNFLK
ncbi:MAG: long-chain acyl-CoA synthetase [Sulfurimonas sp.]|jgi:long-chain acyl-CoA synthetase